MNKFLSITVILITLTILSLPSIVRAATTYPLCQSTTGLTNLTTVGTSDGSACPSNTSCITEEEGGFGVTADYICWGGAPAPTASSPKYPTCSTTTGYIYLGSTSTTDGSGCSTLTTCITTGSSTPGNNISCWQSPTSVGGRTNPVPIPTFTGSGYSSGGGGQGCDNGFGVVTAIGCIPYNPQDFVSVMLKWILGFAGGIALLLMVLGAFQMVTSAGNPDALKSGQERFTSAIIGLIFIVLAVTLLEIIGVDILQIPGLNR